MKLVSIKENHLFQKVYAKGRKAVGRYAAVYVLTDIHAQKIKKAHPLKISVNRVGITVTKKAGGAVLRNRVKRVIREAYRQLCGEFSIRYGKLVVISARDAAVAAKTQDVKDDLKKLFTRLDMLCEPGKESSPENRSDKSRGKAAGTSGGMNGPSGKKAKEITDEAGDSFRSAADAGDNRL